MFVNQAFQPTPDMPIGDIFRVRLPSALILLSLKNWIKALFRKMSPNKAFKSSHFQSRACWLSTMPLLPLGSYKLEGTFFCDSFLIVSLGLTQANIRICYRG